MHRNRKVVNLILMLLSMVVGLFSGLLLANAAFHYGEFSISSIDGKYTRKDEMEYFEKHPVMKARAIFGKEVGRTIRYDARSEGGFRVIENGMQEDKMKILHCIVVASTSLLIGVGFGVVGYRANTAPATKNVSSSQ